MLKRYISLNPRTVYQICKLLRDLSNKIESLGHPPLAAMEETLGTEWTTGMANLVAEAATKHSNVSKIFDVATELEKTLV